MSKPPVVVCTINLKGGVGKSTITALLSKEAHRKGLGTLAIDLDPQANLSQGLMYNGYRKFVSDKKPSIVELFDGYIAPNSSSGGPGPIHGADLFNQISIGPKHSLQIIPSRFDFSDNLKKAISINPKRLASFISHECAHKDIIFIDCAPTESIFTSAAYYASRYVLVPVKPEYFATIGFPLLQKSIESFRNANPAHQIEVCGIVVNNSFYDGGNNGGPEKEQAMNDIKAEAKKHGWPIYKNEIPHSRGFPKMMRGNFSYTGNAYKFSYFAKEFFKSIGF